MFIGYPGDELAILKMKTYHLNERSGESGGTVRSESVRHGSGWIGPRFEQYNWRGDQALVQIESENFWIFWSSPTAVRIRQSDGWTKYKGYYP